jgi:hypothetical protein
MRVHLFGPGSILKNKRTARGKKRYRGNDEESRVMGTLLFS